MAADVEADFAFVGKPVEVAPDFAAVDFFWALVLGKLSQGFDDALKDEKMAGVFVEGAVGVKDLWFDFGEERFKVVRTVELNEYPVVAEARGFFLFTGAGGAAVFANDAAEPVF